MLAFCFDPNLAGGMQLARSPVQEAEPRALRHRFCLLGDCYIQIQCFSPTIAQVHGIEISC